MADPLKQTKRKRRWFQFGLSTLLLFVTLAAGLLLMWRNYVDAFRLQRETMTAITNLGGTYKTELGVPEWMADWFGGPDRFQDVISVDLGRTDMSDDGWRTSWHSPACAVWTSVGQTSATPE